MSKLLLLGDEAIAQAFIDAGGSAINSYPGTPSTQITEYVIKSKEAKEKGIVANWCANEKTALEASIGVAYAGKRAMTCMKHVGLNVCGDPFMNAAIIGTKGVIIVVADDPSMFSSQDEQDSRYYGHWAMIPMLEPSNQQEAYDMVASAFEMSESLKVPVLLRIVTRLAHSRAAVEVGELGVENALNPSTDQWVLLPGIARKKYVDLLEKQEAFQKASETSTYNKKESAGQKLGIVACGIGYNYVKENVGDNADILKVSQYPLSPKAIKAFAAEHESILVVEDGQPVVEETIAGMVGADYPIKGRLTGDLPRTGELTPDSVAKALGKPAGPAFDNAKNLAGRPPQLCQGCGHRDVYTALNQVLAEYPDYRVFGDIGCYTLGALPPFKALSSCVDMGASITMAKGAADAGLFPAVAIIGDSTFTHSGMTGLLDAVNDKSNITVVISDNLTTGMTGGQDSAGTNKFEAICLGLGVEPEHVRVVVPLPKNMPEITRILKEEIEYKGVSVIIPRRECIQTAARHARERRK